MRGIFTKTKKLTVLGLHWPSLHFQLQTELQAAALSSHGEDGNTASGMAWGILVPVSVVLVEQRRSASRAPLSEELQAAALSSRGEDGNAAKR